jgi:catechol 2,3-dioxygenase-like lactoylglutathione lyase family enzyme
MVSYSEEVVMTIKLDHINLTVDNLDQSIEWYRSVFGFELVESGVTPRGLAWRIVAHNDSMICMTEYAGRLSANRNDQKSFHQMNHFGIRVSDKNKWQKKIQENKLELFYGGPIEYPNSMSWYIHDPSGHEIEVSYSAKSYVQFPSASGDDSLENR